MRSGQRVSRLGRVVGSPSVRDLRFRLSRFLRGEDVVLLRDEVQHLRQLTLPSRDVEVLPAIGDRLDLVVDDRDLERVLRLLESANCLGVLFRDLRGRFRVSDRIDELLRVKFVRDGGLLDAIGLFRECRVPRLFGLGRAEFGFRLGSDRGHFRVERLCVQVEKGRQALDGLGQRQPAQLVRQGVDLGRHLLRRGLRGGGVEFVNLRGGAGGGAGGFVVTVYQSPACVNRRQ